MLIDDLKLLPDSFKEDYRGLLLIKRNKDGEVCWLRENFTYSSPIRAYYDKQEGKFFGLDNGSGYPIIVDIYMKLPQPN